MQDLRPQALQALLKCSSQEITKVVTARGSPDDHYGVPLSYILLADADLELAKAMLYAPSATLALLDGCLYDAQTAVLSHLGSPPSSGAAPPSPALGSAKEYVHVRLHSVPHCLDPAGSEQHSPRIAGIGARHMNKLVSVSGTVVRTGAVKMYEAQQLHECTRCKERFLLRCSLEQGGMPVLPEECPRRSEPCGGSNFRRVKDVQSFTAYQEVRVQEKMQCLAMGALPCSVTVLLLDELADSCRPGDDVEVVGVVLPKWRALVPGQRCEAELVLSACHLHVASVQTNRVEVSPQMVASFQEFWQAHAGCVLVGRNKILAGFCPQVCGMFLVKLAALLSMVGGVARQDAVGTSVRGEVHLLLIGDPGTGKSQIMKFACRVSHRSVAATGRGSSSAGLTAVAVKEAGAGGGWSLEAGALVLADGGLCCIDEVEGIREGERATLHEAMEQQTVHVAKAGLVATLSTRTTVMAATNPRPGYKAGQPLSSMTSLSGPLLSRFDLLLVLADTRHPRWDKAVSDQILDNHAQEQPVPSHQTGGATGSFCATASGFSSFSAAAVADVSSGGGGGGHPNSDDGGWTIAVLQRYVLWVKGTFKPTLTQEAEAVLKAYYGALRRSEERSAARTTIRMLESLVRVAQAHARLTAQHVVSQRDAVVAVMVVDASQNVLFLTGGPDAAIHSAFAEDPEQEYQQLEARVLAELQLLPRLPPPPARCSGTQR